ncbi:MAG TPA: hypothetical protein VMH20_09550 [Verrucomicrobiae bacterium]|nr:hypothetical protein [Verrucomicrobiae bacterium]
MPQFRSVLALVIVLASPFYVVPPSIAANASLGVLATHAHLEEAVAFPGLSVYEGERLSTEADGRLGIRAGRSILTLGERTEVWLIPLGGGLHVDMSQGSLHFVSVEHEPMEIHVAEALVSSAGTQESQGSVTLLGPKTLQITAERGDLNFSFQGEIRTLPQGQTYRIYLDDPGASNGTSGGVVSKSSTAGATKAVYFIVGAGVAGATAWGIHEALKSGNPSPISPYKP